MALCISGHGRCAMEDSGDSASAEAVFGTMEDLGDRRRRLARKRVERYRRRLTVQQRDDRQQDNTNRRRPVHQQQSDALVVQYVSSVDVLHVFCEAHYAHVYT